VRGASAIAKVLESHPESPVRVFVVWEPVLWSDALRPSDGALVRKFPDPRASHYWDPKKSLSAEILDSPWTRKFAVRGGPMGIVWDWVACYPRGVQWPEHFPEPAVQGFPVVDAADRVRAWTSENR
jgi:hypothetical protein